IGMTFAGALRSILRQDPDVVLVGEIRDEETAVMAFRAAMTGHQVYSTLHTNSAVGAIPRLLDTGIAPDIMAGNIIGVIGQRLVRKLCERCKRAYEPSKLERQILRLGVSTEVPHVYEAHGCRECEHTGFKGRMALMEVLRFDAQIDELVARRATIHEVVKYARGHGFFSLAEDGIRRVIEGVTSMDEISRKIDLTAGIA
ncbi:MAG: Flp pilus assembly complex ATPase component TadA, partial [Gammaproteobacteria bacterium]|nr:Flp pilus assembly complex ATPase component TadA [Gammaproteobacteria bacterium]